jgi:pyruvate dehydrogenase E2 component (dihydrolipoamide acetyltransferase)
MFSIQLARQGQTMEQGRIVRWNKREGEDIAIGEELYEVETDKAIVPIEATRPGRLLKLLALPGDTIAVGAVLAIVADPGEQVSSAQVDDAVRMGVDAAASAIEAPTVRTSDRVASPADTTKVTAMPKARSLARELGVDLHSVKGSGANGMILPEDVRRAANTSAAPPRAGSAPGAVGSESLESRISKRVPLTAIGRTTIAALERAWQAPQFTQGILVDASALVRRKDASAGRLTYMDFFLDAIVAAARAVPEVVARFGDREILHYDRLDISIATSTDQGLLIPVLRDAGKLSVDERSAAWRAVVEDARNGRLGPDRMSGGIIALSSLGARGVDYGTPLLPAGHAAIVFVGALATRPMVVNDRVEPTASLHVAVTYDHRLVDGVLGSRFTSAIHEALLAPNS